MEIRVDRESVCMADDVTAPNARMVGVGGLDTLSDVLEKVAAGLPKMKGSVWSVDSGRKVIGYILMDDNGAVSYELCQAAQNFGAMGIGALHCRYFHEGRFLYRDGGSGELVEKYPECSTLLEKARRSMGDYFQEELLIRGGGLRIWGEWFGRPHDNVHIVERVCWEKDAISINFCGGESLYIDGPSAIINEEKRFVVTDAARVLWVWYDYGKARTYENMCVREYIKTADGKILRAEGKRRDVGDGDGRLFQPLEQHAVWLEG